MASFPCTNCGAHGPYVGPAHAEDQVLCMSCGNPLKAGTLEAFVPEVPAPVPPPTQAELLAAAERGYHAYGKSTGNKNFRGDEMPPWDTLPQSIRDAWFAAAEEVYLSLPH